MLPKYNRRHAQPAAICDRGRACPRPGCLCERAGHDTQPYARSYTDNSTHYDADSGTDTHPRAHGNL